ncbi:excinuclease ABC subunit UvrC [Pseudorhodoplanes sp.]|uniref:excinuclease ABC subunit UvrC n=1 Tax=Pseudorhodoplanes sp. TaxID=1934341 RepID=UPI002CBC31C3|nr:excinuclease ABC subunit UvrC [Pseudorhodoplanes sp.]HWV51924.1 excinuclease ABC subunit UvrC [Pseudorhodoplanes sp.]
MNGRRTDIEPELDLTEEDEDQTLPLPEPDPAADADAKGQPSLASGRATIAAHLKNAPSGPGVYRMLDAAGEVLYVGKAKSIRKRIASYARPTGHDSRIARMIAATASLEFVTTRTETEALLLEANLIKRLRPRFNVLMRDDKSFPYIVISRDHPAPQILKHRGARTRPGDYFGPFASVWAVNRTITALQRAFLIRSCSDAVFESRTRPCLLHQIKRCSAPCTGEITPDAYAELVREARDFLSGKSHAVKKLLADEMEKASETLDFERAAIYRDRLAALSAIQSQQGVNLRGVDDADVFAIHQAGGYNCVQVFFFRTGQNWGNRAYFPKADRGLSASEVLNAFIAQFYDDKPCPRTILVSEELPERALLAEALSTKSGHTVEIATPKRGEKRDVIDHALANAREALGRKLSETSSQQALLKSLAELFGLPRLPRRIEVYDNSHIQGSNAVGGMIVAGPEGFQKNQYRKFNIRSEDITPGDDFGMMREVLERRFKRLLSEHPRKQHAPASAQPDHADSGRANGGDTLDQTVVALPGEQPAETPEQPADREKDTPWPDLVLIDGGQGQLAAARETLAQLGVTDVPMVAVAKGQDRDAGRETFFMDGREPFRLPPRDPLLYFVERLRDEAHRFAIGSHRTRRKRDIREGGLQEIPGIGPTRKRALLNHFGTLKAIERASLADLAKVPGINADTARRIYDFFHERPA